MVIKMSGDMSIKVPRKSRMKLIMRRITIGLLDMPSNRSNSSAGTWFNASSQPNAEAIPITNRTIAVVRTALAVAITNFRQVNERYTKTVTQSA